MSLYTRNYRPSIGARTGLRIQTGEGLSRILQDSPLSSLFVAPVKTNNTKLLLKYFKSIQVRQYGKSLELEDRAVLSHIKRALNKGYTPAYLCRAIRFASTVSRFPFGISFAIRSLDESGCEFDRFRLNTPTDQPTVRTGTLFDF